MPYNTNCMKPIWEKEEESDVLVKDQVQNNPAIVLYNDDVNSFEHVIDCLIKYCEQSPEQAEQCATIVHHKGKYAVKHGDYDTLRPIYEALLDNHLSAKIEI